MAVQHDLNKMLSEVKRSNADIDSRLKSFLMKYESLHQEANRQLNQERIASGSMQGLEDFHFMVQTIKRNRDVVSSLVRGVMNLRSLKTFSIIEEDIPDVVAKVPKKKGRPKKKLPVVHEISASEPTIEAEEGPINA